jgi:hypothetical protein
MILNERIGLYPGFLRDERIAGLYSILAILTPTVLLVPYSEHHVSTYNDWMQDEVYRYLFI